MQSEFGHMDSTFDLPDSIQRLLTFHFQIDQPKSMHFPTTRMGPYTFILHRHNLFPHANHHENNNLIHLFNFE
jgi:hypothetical protein